MSSRCLSTRAALTPKILKATWDVQGYKAPRRPVGLVLRALALLETLGSELLGPAEALPLADALLPVLRAALPGGYVV